MGVSYQYGHSETDERRRKGPRRWAISMPPEFGFCAYCECPRPVHETALGKTWLPLNGTWWHSHDGGVTCSPLCRALGNYPEGPIDALAT